MGTAELALVGLLLILFVVCAGSDKCLSKVLEVDGMEFQICTFSL